MSNEFVSSVGRVALVYKFISKAILTGWIVQSQRLDERGSTRLRFVMQHNSIDLNDPLVERMRNEHWAIYDHDGQITAEIYVAVDPYETFSIAKLTLSSSVSC
jgi:hypothetical protein